MAAAFARDKSHRTMTVTRFAPSPTGHLHLGHAFSALVAFREGGRFLLRIEDIDRARCRAEYESAIYEDLAWLGLSWETPVRRQSEHFDDYRSALHTLQEMALLYPCFCTRKEIQAEVARAGAAPHGADGFVYPGTCRGLTPGEREQRVQEGAAYALRLDMAKAIDVAGPLSWSARAGGPIEARPEAAGDVVLARKDTPASYHLAVTLDDHLQGVTLITRGEDLFEATHIHRLLQALLGLETPVYHHHPLIADERGRRLAKRDRATTIRGLRETGASAEAVIARIERSSRLARAG